MTLSKPSFFFPLLVVILDDTDEEISKQVQVAQLGTWRLSRGHVLGLRGRGRSDEGEKGATSSERKDRKIQLSGSNYGSGERWRIHPFLFPSFLPSFRRELAAQRESSCGCGDFFRVGSHPTLCSAESLNSAAVSDYNIELLF